MSQHSTLTSLKLQYPLLRCPNRPTSIVPKHEVKSQSSAKMAEASSLVLQLNPPSSPALGRITKTFRKDKGILKRSFGSLCFPRPMSKMALWAPVHVYPSTVQAALESLETTKQPTSAKSISCCRRYNSYVIVCVCMHDD